MIHRAMLGERVDPRDHAYSEIEPEDDLGFAAGLRFLIPAGLIVWAALAFFLIHFL